MSVIIKVVQFFIIRMRHYALIDIISGSNFFPQDKYVHFSIKWNSSDSTALTKHLINICTKLKVGKHLLNINYGRGGEADAQFPKEYRSDEHHL